MRILTILLALVLLAVVFQDAFEVMLLPPPGAPAAAADADFL